MDAGPMDYAALTNALTWAFDSIQRTIPRMGTDRPSIGLPDLTYQRCDDYDWVDSFWSGQLWLAYDETDDETFLSAARAQEPYFYARLDRPDSFNHDLGFLYTLSLVADTKLTGDFAARQGALRAAEALIGRYNPRGRFIQAWNDHPGSKPNRGRMIIDCMENLGLLFWASEETDDPRFREMAIAHAETTARYIVRPDGSSYHTFVFDPDTGAPLRGETAQGYADESCWSRGQSWGIHGFALAHAYTGDPAYAAVAAALADYAIPRLPEDGVPFWDYRLPEDAPHYRDSSAAAIMAAGLFLLADQLDADDRVAHYRATAHRMLDGLIAHYRTVDYPDAEGLLLHGASHVTIGRCDTLLPYGDYFFVEALLRALGRTEFFW